MGVVLNGVRIARAESVDLLDHRRHAEPYSNSREVGSDRSPPRFWDELYTDDDAALVPNADRDIARPLLSPCPLGRAPVVGPLFVVQVPNARDERRVTHCLGPSNGFFLRARGMEHSVGVVFDDIIGDGRSFRPALRSSFHENVSHSGFTAWNELENSPSLKALGS
jgi:hypothetical protein